MAFDKKRFIELKEKLKSGTITDEEKKELEGFKGNGKPRGKGGRGVGRISKSEKMSFGPGNDFSWWSKDPELIKDAANFKCNYIAGTAVAGNDIPFVIPGVLKVTLRSVFGCDYKATDGINVWARELYLRMFQKYRPASGYSASDLGIAIIAGVEFVKLVAKYERVYGIINRYSKLNVNMPLVEAQALGLTAGQVSFLQGNLSDFRYDLNYLLRKAQRLCIPKDLSILADAISLFGYEYLDHDSPRSQFVLFDTDWIGVYSDTALTSGGSIQYEELTGGYAMFDFNADNMCAALEKVLNALIGSDSIQRIYADLVVWFGEGAMLSMLPVPEDYTVYPSYSESILHKLHNLEMSDMPSAWLVSWADPALSTPDANIVNNGYFHVYQSNDRIITKCGLCDPNGTHTGNLIDGGTIIVSNSGTPVHTLDTTHIVDTYRLDATPEVVTEGVLFKYHSRVRSGTDGAVTMIDSAAFYIPVKVQLFDNSGVATNPLVTVVYQNTNMAKAAAGELACIDWAPLTYNVSTITPATVDGVFGDVDNIIVMYQNDLLRLHRTIILSGLKTDVPVVNK